jgi:hypothetical protein
MSCCVAFKRRANGLHDYLQQHGCHVTMGNGVFTESNTLWREHILGLSANSSSPRVKKFSAKIKTLSSSLRQKNYRRRISSPRASRLALAKKFFAKSIFLALDEVIFFKKITFSPSNLFIINMHLYKGYVQI